MTRAPVLLLVMTPPHAKRTTTYFEQVPLKIVRKIAVPAPPKIARPRPPNLTIGQASRKTEPYSMPVGLSTRESVDRDADTRRLLIQHTYDAMAQG
jgi:hypothetical protein